MPSGGIPKLSCLGVLEYYLAVPRESPSLGSCHSLFLRPSWSHPKLENFNHTKLNKTFVRSLNIIKQITTLIKYYFKPIHILLLHYTYCILTWPWLIPPIQSIDSPKQANNTRKIESVKNRTICSNLNINHTYVNPKILKNYGNVGNLYINFV